MKKDETFQMKMLLYFHGSLWTSESKLISGFPEEDARTTLCLAILLGGARP